MDASGRQASQNSYVPRSSDPPDSRSDGGELAPRRALKTPLNTAAGRRNKVGVRGRTNLQGAVFCAMNLEELVPADHPLRGIRRLADAELESGNRPRS